MAIGDRDIFKSTINGVGTALTALTALLKRLKR